MLHSLDTHALKVTESITYKVNEEDMEVVKAVYGEAWNINSAAHLSLWYPEHQIMMGNQ